MKKTMKQRVFAMLMAVALVLSNFTGITAKAEDAPTFVVSIEDTDHGSIVFEETDDSSQSLKEGDRVSVVLEAEKGYIVSKFMIKDAEDGSVITDVITDDDTFAFDMPDYDIIVSGEFIPLNKSIREPIDDIDSQEASNTSETYETTDTTVTSDVIDEATQLSDVAKPTQIIVGTDDDSIFRKTDRIVSSYDGVWIIEYPTYAEAEEALKFFSQKANFAEINEIITIDEDVDETISQDDIKELQADDAFEVLEELVEVQNEESEGERCFNRSANQE